ncbi:MAG: hypothetical protein R3D02_08620 [Hyphomicrobiales bacterium]
MIFLRILGRLFAILFGYALAALTASHVLLAASLVGAVPALDTLFSPDLETLILGVFTAFFIAWAAFLPAAVAIAVAELFSVTDIVFHVGAGGIVAAVTGGFLFARDPVASLAEIGTWSTTVLLACGFAAGLVYWLVAGRGSGSFYSKKRVLTGPRRDQANRETRHQPGEQPVEHPENSR